MSATKPNKPVIAIIRELRKGDVFAESSDFECELPGTEWTAATVRTVQFRTKVIVVSEDMKPKDLEELKEYHAEAFMIAREIKGQVARLLECPTNDGNKRYEFVEFLSETE